MLKKGWVNYDLTTHKRGDRKTNFIGRIENLPFKENSFDEVLCSHVIEHFRYLNGLQVLKDVHYILKPGGLAIFEGPDILGIYWYYIEGWGGRKEPDIDMLIKSLYGKPKELDDYNEPWVHKWGWTGCSLAQEMAEIGFYIRHVGKGFTHGMGKRDFRVEGIKR